MRDLFLEIAKGEINPEITAEDVREMIIQHILTEDIFTNVFGDADFHKFNNIAKELENVIETFMNREVRKNYLKSIENYYNAIRKEASGISDNHEKQKFLKIVYENFYKVYNPKGADKLGVVYTPNEIVRFMIDSTDWLLDKHFNKTLSDKGVDILDPATGTGTFIAELIDRISIHDLEYKYENELHANEVAILPYYIANLNIEYTYQQRKGSYKEFRNICFVDTLDNIGGLRHKGQHSFAFGISSENAKRITDQNSKKISVIIGNPPYNANQANFNDFNKNRLYDHIDDLIKDSFVKRSTAQKTKVYDMYARFYRWAMDRIDDNGIIAFITNRSFIDSRTFDGFRACVEDEFDVAYIIDTRSDVRANPKIAGTSHNVFGIQTGVAIMFLVKKQAETKRDKHKCKIYYAALDDFWRKEEKLSWLNDNPISKIEFDRIEPDDNHNWINQTDNDFETLLSLIDKDVKLGNKGESTIFELFSNGVLTARDIWNYDFSKENLESKMQFFCNYFEKSKEEYLKLNDKKSFNDSEIKFTDEILDHFKRNSELKFQENKIRLSLYRPFVKKWTYFDRIITHRIYQQDKIFPIEDNNKLNLCIGFIGNSTEIPFSVLAFNKLEDYNCLSNAANGTKTLPLYRYDSESQKHENITDWALNQFREHYKESNGSQITKEDIFHYVYAVLHSPVYRKKYEQNLKREFPRIPFYDDFFKWKQWGKDLMDLHINYETQTPFALERNDLDLSPKKKIKQDSLFGNSSDAEDETFTAKVQTKLRADKENNAIIIDSQTTLTGIPTLAWEYKLGNRSAIEWILDQYKEKTPQDATIREKFNTYKFADYKEQVIELLRKVTNVSIKTMKIIDQMPKE